MGSWEIAFLRGLRHLAAKIFPLLEKCSANKQLLTACLSCFLWLTIQSLVQSFICKSISGSCCLLIPPPLCALSIRRIRPGQIHAGE